MTILTRASVLLAATLGAGSSVPGCGRAVEPDARLVSIAEIKGFDPILANDQYSSGAQVQVYEGLNEFHYLKRPIELEPLLAEGPAEVSADGLVYTFRLREAVFQDDPCFPGGKGRAVTAHDFVWCWKRLVAVPNSTGSWIFEDRIAGLDAWADRARKRLSELFDSVNEHYPFEHEGMRELIAEEVPGLRAVDDRTLRVELVRPFPQFLWLTAMSYTVVYPREAVERHGVDFFRNPVGCGPYRVEEFWPFDRSITFLRNPTWHGGTYPSEGAPGDRELGLLEDAGKPLPFLDRIEFVTISASQPRWLRFLQGNVDRVETEAEIWRQAMTKDGRLRDDLAREGIVVQRQPKADLAFNVFNMDDPVLGAPAGERGRKVRQAMCLAYDSEAWFQVMRNGAWATKAHGPIPPTVAGYVEEPKSPYSTVRDVVRARKLLAEAGYPEGKGLPKLVYELSGTDPLNRNGAEIFKNSMAEIGIRVELSPNTWDQFDDKVKKRKAQVFGMAWGADYPDAENFLQLFYSKNASPGSNGSNYADPEYDRLYEEMARMPPGPARNEVIRRMLSIVNEDCPMNYNDHRIQYSYARSWFRNFKFLDINPWLFKYYRVDREEKARRLGERAK